MLLSSQAKQMAFELDQEWPHAECYSFTVLMSCCCCLCCIPVAIGAPRMAEWEKEHDARPNGRATIVQRATAAGVQIPEEAGKPHRSFADGDEFPDSYERCNEILKREALGLTPMQITCTTLPSGHEQQISVLPWHKVLDSLTKDDRIAPDGISGWPIEMLQSMSLGGVDMGPLEDATWGVSRITCVFVFV